MSNEGISFVVRVKNEEAYLKDSLQSLQSLQIPYEVIVILHNCTDRSKEIAQSFPNITIKEYSVETARAGYETLITPANHKHSFITYSRFCFSNCKYKWQFRWDADFKASTDLINFLNTFDYTTNKNIKIRIPCKLGDTNILNKELYLSNCFKDIQKYLFWEIYCFDTNSEEITLDDNLKIDSISNKILKQYWLNKPVWLLEDIELNEKYNQLINLAGPEPAGMARASNEEANIFISKIHSLEQKLKEYNIHFTL